MSLDIIITTHNAVDKLQKCINSVLSESNKTTSNIYVINDCSTDSTSSLLESIGNKQKNFSYKNLSENCGCSYSMNTGIKMGSADKVLLIDDDAELVKGSLEKLINTLENQKRADPKIVMCGAKILDSKAKHIFSAEFDLTDFAEKGRGELDFGQRNYIKECDAIVGTCVLIQREIFEKVGFFNVERYQWRTEDIEYCVRLRTAGYKILYNGEAEVLHHHLFRVNGPEKASASSLDLKKQISGIFPLVDSDIIEKNLFETKKLFSKKLYDEALNLHLSLDPKFLDNKLVGDLYFALKKYQEATMYYQKLFKLKPFDPFLAQKISDVHKAHKNFELSKEYAQLSLTLVKKLKENEI